VLSFDRSPPAREPRGFRRRPRAEGPRPRNHRVGRARFGLTSSTGCSSTPTRPWSSA